MDIGTRRIFIQQVGYEEATTRTLPAPLTSLPWRYKDMNIDELSAIDREVVEVLMKFKDRLSTKGLVRVYNSVHPIIDIEGIYLWFQLFQCV